MPDREMILKKSFEALLKALAMYRSKPGKKNRQTGG